MVQFQEKGEIVVYNLVCRRVNGPHNAENIKTWLKDIVADFEIDEKQLLVLSVDSAANIQAAARSYLKELDERFAVPLDQVCESESETEADLNSQINCENIESGFDENEISNPPELTGSLP